MVEFTKEHTESLEQAWQQIVEKLEFRENGEYTAFGRGETLNERNKHGNAFMAELQTMPPEQREEAVRARLAELDARAQEMQAYITARKQSANSPEGVEYDDYQKQLAATEAQLEQSRKFIQDASSGIFVKGFAGLLAGLARANSAMHTGDAMLDAANNPDFNDQERTFEKIVDNAQGVEAVAQTISEQRAAELVSKAAEHKHDVNQARDTRYNIEHQKIGAIVDQVGRIYDEKISEFDSEYEIYVMQREKQSVIEKLTEKNGEYAKSIAYTQERIDGMNIPIKDKDALKIDVIEAAIAHKGDGKDFSRDYFKNNPLTPGMEAVNIASLVSDSSKMMSITIKEDGVVATFAGGAGKEVRIGGAEVADQIKKNGIDLGNWKFESKYGNDTRRVNVHENLGINDSNPLIVHGDTKHVRFDGRSNATGSLDRLVEMAGVVTNIKSAGGVDDNVDLAVQERAGQLSYGARKRMVQKMEFAIRREAELEQREGAVYAKMSTLSDDAQQRVAAQFDKLGGKMADIERYARGMPKETNDPNTPVQGGQEVGGLAANGPAQQQKSTNGIT